MAELSRSVGIKLTAGLITAVGLAGCGGGHEVPEPGPSDVVQTVESPNSPSITEYIYRADGVRAIYRLPYVTDFGDGGGVEIPGHVSYQLCTADAELIRSDSDDVTETDALWEFTRTEPFEGCLDDGMLTIDDFAPGTIITYPPYEARVNSIPALMEEYATDLKGTGENEMSAVTYHPDGSATFNFLSSALQSAETHVFTCEGPGRHTLTVTNPEYRSEQSDGTIDLHPAVHDIPAEGEDVCADSSVTAEDHIESRPEIIFED